MGSHSLQITDLRALEQFDAVPAGCTGMIVTSSRFAPHLRPGEIAVVDLSDKEPVSGELFVIGINNRFGEREPRIVQTIGRVEAIVDKGKVVDCLCWWDRFKFKRPGEMTISDGPMLTEDWRDQRCIGRIAGFMAPKWEQQP